MNPQLQISPTEAALTRSATDMGLATTALGRWGMAYCPAQGLDFGGFGRIGHVLATVPSCLAIGSKDQLVGNAQEGSL